MDIDEIEYRKDLLDVTGALISIYKTLNILTERLNDPDIQLMVGGEMDNLFKRLEKIMERLVPEPKQ